MTDSWLGGGGRFGVLVHGGAGVIAPARRALAAEGCAAAARRAVAILRDGGGAIDAVQCAVEVLEGDEDFNAGRGASLTIDGTVELDASLMEGRWLRAGAVCSVQGFVHPVRLARAALEDGRHVFYSTEGARRLARVARVDPVDPGSLVTVRARERLEALRTKDEAETWTGTVGAVARDASGDVAAGTSTGGTMGKRVGRVGDSPVVGAGTYADDRAGAVSATGDGEGILRLHLAATVHQRLLEGAAPHRAAEQALGDMRRRVRATGGLIVIDAAGRLGWARTTPAMSWAACWDEDREAAGV